MSLLDKALPPTPMTANPHTQNQPCSSILCIFLAGKKTQVVLGIRWGCLCHLAQHYIAKLASLALYPLVCLSVCLSVCMSVNHSVTMSLPTFSFFLIVSPPLVTSVYLSLSLYISLFTLPPPITLLLHLLSLSYIPSTLFVSFICPVWFLPFSIAIDWSLLTLFCAWQFVLWLPRSLPTPLHLHVLVVCLLSVLCQFIFFTCAPSVFLVALFLDLADLISWCVLTCTSLALPQGLSAWLVHLTHFRAPTTHKQAFRSIHIPMCRQMKNWPPQPDSSGGTSTQGHRHPWFSAMSYT